MINMSKKANSKNQEKLKIYLQKNDLQSSNKENKANILSPLASEKLLQGASNGLSKR